MSERVHIDQFEVLLSRLCDAGLTDAEVSQLGRFVESDSSLKYRYIEYCQMHALLRAKQGFLSSWDVPDGDTTHVSKSPKQKSWRSRRLVALLFVAATLLVISGLGVWNYGRDNDSGPIAAGPPYRGKVVARLKNQVCADFVFGPHGEKAPNVGAAIPQGTYELRNGIIELEANCGAVLTIEAPAMFTMADDECIRIDHGRLAAHVPKQAIGFRVETASATVVDLGTDFAVDAVAGESSEVHVFKGEVRINLHGSMTTSASPLSLTTGEATRIDFLTGMPSGINLDAERFLRGLDDMPRKYSKRVLELQPAVYYPMEPVGDGLLLKNIAPNGIDAKIIFGRASVPVWAPGKIGAAFALGGPAQQTYATAPHYPQADGDQLSVMAWVTARSRPRWASIAKNWAGSEQWGQFHFGLYYDSGELEAHIQDDSGKEITVKDEIPLPLNDWHHVAFVADGSTLRLYRNGREVASAPYHQLRRDPRIKALAIGTKLNLSAEGPDQRDFNMWDGRLDELAIFNHALSSEQVRELYELGSVEN